jgi:hypothetical protein
MKCEFDDGLKVDYAKALRVTKGDEINVFLAADDMPSGLRAELDAAASQESCGELRKIAKEVTDTVGGTMPE